MNNFKKEDFKELLQLQQEPAISIYLPMAKAGEDTLKNPIRVKNALKQVQNKLQNANVDDRMVEESLTRLSELMEGFDISQDQLGGLAIFLADDYTKLIKLPYRFEEWIHIGSDFELRPLLQAYQNDTEFYIIALSRKHSRLFRGSKFNIVELELGSDVPTSFEEAMRFDEPEDQLQHQTISGADGGNTPVFHGHTESDREKKNLRRFFGKLDSGIINAVTDHDKPFLLVGLEYLQPIYRDVSDLPYILETGLDKNPDGMDITDLHTHVWKKVKETLEPDLMEAVKEYKQMLGSDLSLSDIVEIPLAAAYGKVDKLLVEKKTQINGQVHPEQKLVELKEEDAIDLLRFSVNQTLLHSGEVYVFDEDEMPSQVAPALAVLRY